jgi:TPR repeat protein
MKYLVKTSCLEWHTIGYIIDADSEEDATTLVKEGDGDAMWMLGVCYEFERGIEQDIERAEKLYKESRERGNEIGKFFERHGRRRGSEEMRMESLRIKP